MRIVIIGARADGHANVVRSILLDMGGMEIIGFIDDDPAKQGLQIHDIPVIGTTTDLSVLKEKYALEGGIVAIGNNAERRRLGGLIRNSGLQPVNAIHPTAHLDRDVVLGQGCYIGQGVMVVTGTRIGDFVNIHTSASIDHDNILEDGANLGPGVHTAGRVFIGKDAFLGSGAVVIPDGIVGEGALVGAGSVVIRPVAPYSRVVGVPAHPIK